MSAETFRRALDTLGLSQSEAAVLLGAGPKQGRVSEWSTGARGVPHFVAAHVETLLAVAHLVDVATLGATA